MLLTLAKSLLGSCNQGRRRKLSPRFLQELSSTHTEEPKSLSRPINLGSLLLSSGCGNVSGLCFDL